MGGCCITGLGALGIDPVSGALAANKLVADAQHLWEDFKQMFGIGAGAREADVIVPFQNKIHEEFLAPTVEMGSHPELHTCVEMTNQLNGLKAAYATFRLFLTSTDWQDGRAAQQALYWLDGGTPPAGSEGQEPTAFLVMRDFTEDVRLKCEESGFPFPGGGINIGGMEISFPMLALGGVAAYFLLKK